MAIQFDPRSPEFAADPYPFYEELRKEAPVYKHAGFWTANSYEAVQTVLRNPDIFSSAPMGGKKVAKDKDGKPIPGSGSVIAQDPPVHSQQRRIVSRAFTPRRIALHEQQARGIVDELFAEFESKGRCDLVKDLANPLPVSVIAEMLGLDVDRREEFKAWATALIIGSTTSGAARGSKEHRKLIKDFRDFTLELIEQRQKDPGDDLVSILVNAEAEEGALDVDQVFAFTTLLLSAGSETTTNLIGSAMLRLLEHPEQLAEVAADHELIAPMLEEALRLESPVQMAMRIATRDTEVCATQIPKGSFILALIGSGNRDTEKYEDPDRFDIHRVVDDHLAFGHGHHFCLGASLARLEAKVAFESILTKLKNPKLGSGGIERPGSMLVRGLSSMDLRFD